MSEPNNSILVQWHGVWFPSITETLKTVWLVLAGKSVKVHPVLRQKYGCQPDAQILNNDLYVESKTTKFQRNVRNLLDFIKDTDSKMIFLGKFPYHVHFYDDLIENFIEEHNIAGDYGFHTNVFCSGGKLVGTAYLAVMTNGSVWPANCQWDISDAADRNVDIDKTLELYDLVSRFEDLRLWDKEEEWAPKGTPKYYEQRDKTSEEHIITFDSSFTNDLINRLKNPYSYNSADEVSFDPYELPF